MDSFGPEFGELYGRLTVASVKKGNPWAVALYEAEQDPRIMDVLNLQSIPLSFPKEVKNSLRTSVQSAIEAVYYMFLQQVMIAGESPGLQEHLRELPFA